MSGENRNIGRRGWLRGIGSLTTFSLIGSGTGIAVSGGKVTPEPYGKHGSQGSSPNSDVYLRHISELSSIRAQLSAYETTRNPKYLFTFDLQETLSDLPDGSVDITVSTAGERTTMTTNGNIGRKIYGWQPSTDEVEQLSRFGEITFVPSVASTKVGMTDVAVRDLSKIAALDFVLEIGHDPEVHVQTSPPENSLKTSSTNTTADDLKTSSHLDFESASYSLTSLTQIGIVDTGYTGNSKWDETWAKTIGIDKDLANDFTEENDWQSGIDHGTDVADTAAYMMKDGDTHSDLFVPLKVFHQGDWEVKTSAVREAIEYALTNDIPVLNISIETKNHSSYCTSTLCEELDSYASAGYVAACATGNDSKETEVCHPATSWFTVGVGGYSGTCSGGYHRYDDPEYGSDYGTIQYYDNNLGAAYCSWCYDAAGWGEFQPNVYGCGVFKTDDGKDASGTSVASPQVAAAAGIQYAVHGSTDYSSKVSTYNDMNDKTVCPSGSSELGDVLHVPDVT